MPILQIALACLYWITLLFMVYGCFWSCTIPYESSRDLSHGMVKPSFVLRFVPMTTSEIIVSLWAGTRGYLDKAKLGSFLGNWALCSRLESQIMADHTNEICKRIYPYNFIDCWLHGPGRNAPLDRLQRRKFCDSKHFGWSTSRTLVAMCSRRSASSKENVLGDQSLELYGIVGIIPDS